MAQLLYPGKETPQPWELKRRAWLDLFPEKQRSNVSRIFLARAYEVLHMVGAQPHAVVEGVIIYLQSYPDRSQYFDFGMTLLDEPQKALDYAEYALWWHMQSQPDRDAMLKYRQHEYMKELQRQGLI